MLGILCCILESRRNQHESLVSSVARNCANAEVLIYSDHQDLPTIERYNQAYRHFKSDRFAHYMFGASDITIDTPKFDLQIYALTDEFQRRFGHRCWILYPDDGIHGQNLVTHPVFTREYLDAAGEFFPSGYFRHSYCDNYLWLLGARTRTLIYCPALKLIHHHPLNRKGAMDEHYAKVYDPEYYEQDRKLFERCVVEHLPVIFERIMSATAPQGINPQQGS